MDGSTAIRRQATDTGAASRILLGWERLETRQRIGIAAPMTADQDELPIWLDGEGHRLTIAPSGAGKTTGPVVADLLTHAGPTSTAHADAGTLDGRRFTGEGGNDGGDEM